MIRVSGQCYEIREKLKALGCVWDGDEKAWFAPDNAHGSAQALADAENRREWREYLGTLPWVDGEFTGTVWNAGMRAASLFIPIGEAIAEISGRVRVVKSVGDKWFARNVGRAYEAAGNPTGATWRPEAGTVEKREKPVFRSEVLERVAGGVAGGFASEIDVAWLADRSPIDPCGVTPGDFLGALYEPGERVITFDNFKSQGQWIWSAEEGFVPDTVLPAALYEKVAPAGINGGAVFAQTGPRGIWYLCNPVTGAWEWMEQVASDDDPHWSRRWEACVTSWRYIVLESDKAKARQWLAAAVQLPFRISAIYSSGGKSVHVLVRIDARTKREWDELRDDIKPIVIALGADQGCMSAVRLTRLPACWREGQDDKEAGKYVRFPQARPQRLLYLNPSPDMTPIVSRPVLRDALGPWVRLAESIIETDPTELDPAVAVECALALEFFRKGALALQVKAKLREVLP